MRFVLRVRTGREKFNIFDYFYVVAVIAFQAADSLEVLATKEVDPDAEIVEFLLVVHGVCQHVKHAEDDDRGDDGDNDPELVGE